MLIFNERLRSVISELGLADKDFAAAGGVTRQTLSGYLNTDREPGRDTLAAWVKAYGINAHWLLTGEGPMLKSSVEWGIKRLHQNAPMDTACVLGPDDETPVGRIVPVYSMAAAGQAIELTDVEPICRVCIPITYVRESIWIVQIEGHSMEPEIKHGSFVGLDTEKRSIVAGEKYGVRIPYEGLTVKRVFIDPKAGELVLRSINPEHPEMRVPLDNRDGLIVGRAVWVMQGL
jgi:phage repressor protein C with HTH and peptisase S24 domain